MIAIAVTIGTYLVVCLLLYVLLPFLYQWKIGMYMLKPNQQRITGMEALIHLLQRYGLQGKIRIEVDVDFLCDLFHFDNNAGLRVLHISPQTATYTTLGALAIVAHEVGHAIQNLVEFEDAAITVASGLIRLYESLRRARRMLFPLGLTLVYIQQPVGFYLLALAVLTCIPGIAGAWLYLVIEQDATDKALRLLRQNLLVHDHELAGIAECLMYAKATHRLRLLQCVGQLLFLSALALTVTLI